MNISRQALLVIHLLLLSCYGSLAQDTAVVVLHPALGSEIDQIEKRELNLFEMIPNKEYRTGSFYMLEDSSLYLRIVTLSDKVLNLPYSWENFRTLKSEIGGKSIIYPGEIAASKEINDDKAYVILELEGGGSINGLLKEVGEEYLFLESEAGEVKIRKTQIKKLSFADESMFRNGKYWFPNPNDTRYLFGPTAYPLGKGEGYYQNVYILFNTAFVGITDNWDVGGGMELISTLSGNPILFVSTKLGFEVVHNFHLAGGMLAGTLLGFDALDDNEILGIFYGVGTVGNREDNISLGLGYGFIEGETADRPQITLSGMKRISRRVSLVSENWLLPVDGYYGAFSVGVRLMGEKTTFDLALFRTSEWDVGLLAVPFLGFVYKF